MRPFRLWILCCVMFLPCLGMADVVLERNNRKGMAQPAGLSNQAVAPEMRRILDERFPLDFDGILFLTVIETLGFITDANVVSLEQGFKFGAAPVKLKFEGSTVEEALNRLCAQMGLTWAVEGTVIKIGRAQKVRPARSPCLGPVPATVQQKLGKEVSTDFEEAMLADVAEFMREQTGLQFVVFLQDPAPMHYFGGAIDLHVRVSAEEALNLICQIAEVSWAADGNLIKIGRPERLQHWTRRRVGVVRPDMQEKLDKKVSIDVRETPLPRVLQLLHETTGAAFAVRIEPLSKMSEVEVTLHFDGTLGETLDLICQWAGTMWQVEADRIVIFVHEVFPVAESGDVARLEQFLEAEPEVVWILGPNSQTALHRACIRGGSDAVRLLLARDSDVNAYDDEHLTPLHWAVKESQKHMVEVLLAYGADVNARDSSDRTPLHLAAEQGDYEAVELLLNNGAAVNARDFNEQTPLYEAIGLWDTDEQHLKVVRLLLDKGADVTVLDWLCNTPLDHAGAPTSLENGQVSYRERVIELLEERGAKTGDEIRRLRGEAGP